MRYQGGKSRIAKQISDVIMRYQGGKSRISKQIAEVMKNNTFERERE